MEVKIILDSISREGIRLTTMHLRYWRAIHAEFMTHRVFSRNARSSRAVPVVTLLSEDIFIPQFGLNRAGMQSTEEPDVYTQIRWANEWEELAEINRSYVRRWGDEGMHKQHANRPLEWFGWIDVLVSSTDWENFWALRIDGAAQPELCQLATEMHRQFNLSQPNLLQHGEWHMPYVDFLTEGHELLKERWDDGEENRRTLPSFEWYGVTRDLLKLSTARCARISYKPFDGKADFDSEMDRYKRLIESRPVHASPAEHQATPDSKGADQLGIGDKWLQRDKWGNFYGWIQNRKLIRSESVVEVREPAI